MGYADIGTARVQEQFFGPEEVDFSSASQATFGGFAGQHTVAEVRDLIRALEFRTNRVREQLAQVQARRPSPPSATQAALDADMVAFLKRWVDVRDRQTLLLAASVASNPRISPLLIPAEANFVAVENATRIEHPRLGDVQNRVDAEARTVNLPAIDLSAIPSQNSPDADFATLRVLDSAIQAGEGAAGAVVNAGTGAEEKARSWFSIPWWGYVLGVVTVGGIGYSFYRAHQTVKARAAWGERYIQTQLMPRVLPGSEPMPTFARDPVSGIIMPVAMGGQPSSPPAVYQDYCPPPGLPVEPPT